MAGSTARRRCAPSSAVATPPTGFSSPMSRPPSPPGTGPAPFACRAPMQHGKPDDHDDDPFPAGRGVTAGTRANARPLPSCHPGAAAPYRRGTGPAHPDASRLQGRDDRHRPRPPYRLGRCRRRAGRRLDRRRGQVLAVVDWPAAAASWLRPAQRLAGSQPDAWILADTPAGCAQLARRLTGQPGWTPGRTFGFASVATPDLLALTPPGALAGMTGATAAGGSWRIGQGLLLVNDDPEGATP